MNIMYFMGHSRQIGGAACTLLRQAELMKRVGNRILVVISCYEGEACDSYMTFCRQYHIEMISASDYLRRLD